MKRKHATPIMALLVLLALLLSGCIGGSSSYRVAVDIVGEGTVTVDPDKERYPKGDPITLTATPAANYDFSGWEGSVTGEEAEISAVVNRNLAVTAVFVPLTTDAIVTGVIVDGRTGPGLAGAEVRWGENYVTYTDEDGAFSLPIAAGVTADILVTGPELHDGRLRIQDVRVEAGEELYVESPILPAIHPQWSNDPLTLSGNIAAGTRLSGEVPLEIWADQDITIMSVMFNVHRARFVFITLNAGDSRQGLWDTTQYPNGDGFIEVFAYDANENLTLWRIPVVIDNPTGGAVLPSGVPYLEVIATTIGENLQFYSLSDPEATSSQWGEDGSTFVNPQAAEPNSRIYVDLEWYPAEDADGYRVYRSFDGASYQLIGDVTQTRLRDLSAQLTPGREVWYRVEPYNRAGSGPWAGRSVTPLPSYRVSLVEPARGSSDVSLTPTLVWQMDSAQEFPVEVEFFHEVWVVDVLDQILYAPEDIVDPSVVEVPEFMVENDLETTVPEGILRPGRVYAWDVDRSFGYMYYSDDDLGLAVAISLANDAASYAFGTVDGAAYFTTTTGMGDE